MADGTEQQFLLALLQAPAASLADLVAAPAVSAVLAHSLAHSLAHPYARTQAHAQGRLLVHAVVARLALTKNALPLPLLALYADAYLATNRRLVHAVARDALAATPKLAQHLAPALVDALAPALLLDDDDDDDHHHHDDQLRTARVILALVRATVPTSSVWAPEPVIRLMHLLRAHYPPSGQDRDRDLTRLALVETAYDLVLAAAHLGVDTLHPVLAALLPDPAVATDADLAHDLATLYDHPRLADQLGETVLGAVGPIARSTKDLIARLARLAPRASGADAKDGSPSFAGAEWLTALRIRAAEAEREPARDGLATPATTSQAPSQAPSRPEQEAELTKVRREPMPLFLSLSLSPRVPPPPLTLFTLPLRPSP